MLLLPALSILITCCSSYKILVYNRKSAYSHMNFLGKVADTLVDAGHDVVTLQPVIVPMGANGTRKSRIIHVELDKKLAADLMGDRKDNAKMWTNNAANPLLVLEHIPFMRGLTIATTKRILDDKELLEQLKSENFDVGIAELFDYGGIPVFEAIGLKNIIGAHTLSCLSEATAYAIGVPVIPSFMPASQGITDDSTSFSNRAINLLFTYFSYYFQISIADAAETVMMEKLGKAAVPVWDVVANMSWILTNTEPFLEFAKPTLHKVVDIGGIGVPKPKPLEEKWNKILNLRSRTVLISFGSMVKSKAMPYEYKTAIIELVKSYPDITFIWKYEDPDDAPFAAGVENLFLSQWTPQNDLLASQGITDDSTSFSNRAINLLFTYFSYYFQVSIADAAETVMMEKLGKAAVPIWDVVANMSWILTNTEPFLEFAKPTLHKVVDIGGIGVPKPKPLEEKWNKILNLRSRTVLISFGSMVKSKAMPYEYKTAIVELVKSYPDITFIWKYEDPDDAPFAAGVENLFLSQWTPQNDLLADDRLTLFITHGGAGSLLESATSGKPVILIPLYGDQVRNAKLAIRHGFGIMLTKEDLGDSTLMHETVAKILNDKKYTKAAHRIRNLLAKRPFSPEEKLLKTVELAVEFGPIPELYILDTGCYMFFCYLLGVPLLKDDFKGCI
ncbi:glycosyltransferase family 28 protein [Oesophagostomum dentatum]|uniref:glucuronosyltransferase n=1 Tax=Oesophagostomum dentatum TaxID=61180 RepID=A0A0B1TCV8_OESDE|nr:glycosyltransferase family 28 protein [Oesophagostomum dentatum]